MSPQKNPKKRKNDPKEAAKKVLVTAIVGFVAVAFIGSFAYNYTARRGGSKSLAVVNGETVVVGSDSLFANFYRQFYEEQRQADEEVTEEKNRQLMRRALDTVIQRMLILQYAEEADIRVSKETVLQSIANKGYYATPGKKFDEQRYASTPESDKQRVFKNEEEQLIIELFLRDFSNASRVTEVELEAFFNLTDYGKKIEYVMLRYDDVPEEELRSFFEQNPKLFEQVHAAHILIKEDEEKARMLYEKVKADPDLFEETAKSESEDTTAEKGGDLGWFYRSDMVPEFSEVAFKLAEGEISEPVKTVFGYHIIKALEPVKALQFDEALYRVKREYVKAHRDEVTKSVGEKTGVLLGEMNADPWSFSEIAEKHGFKTGKTGFISVDGQYILNEEETMPLFELMNIPTLVDLVFATDRYSVGGPVKSSEGEIIFKVLEEKEPDRSEYEKARSYLQTYYAQLKENSLFNDWYIHTLKESKITDNFDTFFGPQG